MKKNFITIATVLTSSVFSASAFAYSPLEVMDADAETAAQEAANLWDMVIKTNFETMNVINDAETAAQKAANLVDMDIKTNFETMNVINDAETAAQRATKLEDIDIGYAR